MLQHLSKAKVEIALSEIAFVLAHDVEALIQMPNRLGIRSAYHQLGQPKGIFSHSLLDAMGTERTFTRLVDPCQLTADGYFGLGIQPDDRLFIPRHLHPVLTASELLRKTSLHFVPLSLVADSLYLSARKMKHSAPGLDTANI